MENLFTLLIWGGAIFLMMRFGCGSHAMGHGQKKNSQTTDKEVNIQQETQRLQTPVKDIDPVCGETVSTEKAKPSVFGGKVYYFCARECREVFEAAPEIYVPQNNITPPPRLEHTHA